MLLQVKTSNEIAAELEMSPEQIKTDVETARLKLGARSRAELVMIYSTAVSNQGR